MKPTIENYWFKNFHIVDKEQAQKIAITVSFDGTTQLLSDEMLNQYQNQHFTMLSFEYREIFSTYRDAHAMGPILNKLKEGMDDISCEYIDLHERLLDLTRIPNQYLINIDFVWTNTDKERLKYYEECKSNNNPPMLNNVDITWGTAYTNCYGLYDLPPKILKRINGKTIIDAGGFIGDTLTVFRAHFPDSICHSFEPVAKNFNYMNRLFKKDIQEGKVVAVQKALGDKYEIMNISKINRSDKIYANSTLMFDFKEDNEHEKVEIIPLDDYVLQNNLEIGLIKMDVEGFEPQLIAGALKTITKQKPVLAISCYHTPEEFYELKPYLESLNLGYKFMLRHSTLMMPLGDLVIVAYPEEI